MKFCRQCGRTLAILQDSSSHYCKSCTAAGLDNLQQSSPPAKADDDILAAQLSIKNGKIVLESKEGWLLWSGSDTASYSLQAIIDRAAPILKIRKRRVK
jgi:hypothetical protein